MLRPAPRSRRACASRSAAKIGELTDLLDAPECDAGRVRIEIWVDGVDPPAGHVADGGVGVPFCGWIDLLAVLSQIVGTPGDEDGQLSPRAEPELGEDV